MAVNKEIKNGTVFEVKSSSLRAGNIHIILPENEDDRFDFLRALAMICAESCGDSLQDADGETIDSYQFWD